MKSRIPAVLLSFLLAVGTVSAGQRESPDFVYAAYEADGTVRKISTGTKPPAVFIGHAGRAATLCGKDEDVICIRSLPFSFAVPKTAELAVGHTWMHDGLTYSVVSTQEVRLPGRTASAVVISTCSAEGGCRSFVYSRAVGLVGFTVPTPDKKSHMYWIQGASGFPVGPK
ncbi:hypothetical protein GCM10011521_19840 [Arenimonas soli]|uniref:Uncharacterized protein n=1 Tax=Arenimonas soli TaxID=2269504 RepID=A0ABQ1HLS1_9GAMM|nr:hypothetical protein [Arenimonas soli]GGA81517.1 hypothetical protein GCM10011521_19840 [Arenimonas soli]